MSSGLYMHISWPIGIDLLDVILPLWVSLLIFSLVPPPVYSELSASGKFEVMSQQVDEEEHSIEMHLPYIAKVMESKRGSYTIVPVLVGAINHQRQEEYGKIFSTYLADPQNLFVISSDFCHWGEYRGCMCLGFFLWRENCPCTYQLMRTWG